MIQINLQNRDSQTQRATSWWPKGEGDFSDGSAGKESAGDTGNTGSTPGFGRSPWRRKWWPTPVFLTEKPHGQRNLAGYSPWGHKESDTTERLSTHGTKGGRGLRESRSVVSDSLRPMDYTVRGILQARILEWVVYPFSSGSSQPRNQAWSPALQADSLPTELSGKQGEDKLGVWDWQM